MIVEIPQELQVMIEYRAKQQGISSHAFAVKTLEQAVNPSYANGDFNFDLARIDQSIKSGRIDVPNFDDMDEFLAWVNS